MPARLVLARTLSDIASRETSQGVDLETKLRRAASEAFQRHGAGAVDNEMLEAVACQACEVLEAHEGTDNDTQSTTEMGGSIGFCGRSDVEKCRSLDCKPREHPDAAGPPPAGAIFAETLAGLNEVDQQLLLFCSKGQSAAVRWLLRFGADAGARDCNGTTGLHAACRKGSLRVVQALLDIPATDSSLPVNIADASGWTPLHVAACNGRQAVAAALLRSHADAAARNKIGQVALELCVDSATKSLLMLRREDTASLAGEDLPGVTGGPAALEKHIPHAADMADTPSQESQGDPDGETIRYEPFFVPREPLIPAGARDNDFLALCVSQRCFNSQAGRGLAFLVASGTLRDRPTCMVDYWRMNRLSAEQMGLYLSEDFSLAKILRMEYLNSIRFVNTGVMAALCFAFSEIALPWDLQCLDRITWSLAEVWVRQHLRSQTSHAFNDESSVLAHQLMQEAAESTSVKRAKPCGRKFWEWTFCTSFSSRNPDAEMAETCPRQCEHAGALLRVLAVESETIMLHWNHYADLPDSQRVLLQDWVDMHRAGDNQTPRRQLQGIISSIVLAPIYEMVSNWKWEPLQIGKPRSPDPKSEDGTRSLFDGVASVEGWAYAVGDDFLSHVNETAQGSIEQERIHEALGYVCEGTFSARVPIAQSAVAAPISHAMKAVPMEDSTSGMHFSSDVWISLCGPLLLLSFDQVTCPFAFMYLGKVQLRDINPGRALFSLEAPQHGDETSRLELVLLLPDARWHVCSLQKLVLQLTDATHLKDWIACFADLALMTGSSTNSSPLKQI
eukprot:s28_g17.t1